MALPLTALATFGLKQVLRVKGAAARLNRAIRFCDCDKEDLLPG
jgi:hypothetical protein